MTKEARALIAEGRKHDEAMTDAPWSDWPGMQGLPGFPRILGDMKLAGREEIAKIGSWTRQRENAAGIAWLRTNLASLLTGYASALDEVERLRAEASKEAAATHELAEEHEKQGMDLAFHRGGHIASLAELATAHTSIGELKLVIEQQDRDMARVRAALVKVHDDAVYDNNHERYLEIADILDQGAPCTEATK